MTNQANFESATLELLRTLKRKKEIVQARHAEELAQIDREIDAVSTTVRLLRESGQNPDPVQEEKMVIPSDLHGKSAREACIEIAKNNNGIVRVSDARDALVSAHILKPGKNTWGIIYTTMARSKEFKKGTERGVFRLTEPEAVNTQRMLQ